MMCSKLFVCVAAVLVVTADIAEDGTTGEPCVGDDCVKAAYTPAATSRAPASQHQQKCTPAEEKQAGCLNGDCFALHLGGSAPALFCRCQQLYEGPRCEKICSECYRKAVEEEARRADMNLALGIGIPAGALVLIIVIVIVYKCVRWRQRKTRKTRTYRSVPFEPTDRRNTPV